MKEPYSGTLNILHPKEPKFVVMTGTSLLSVVTDQLVGERCLVERVGRAGLSLPQLGMSSDRKSFPCKSHIF